VNLRVAFQTIYDQHGRLDPALIVAVARDKKHPLHSRVFDVPPGEAAERYYLQRAHELIQSVRIAYRKPDSDQQLKIRAFHAVAGPGGHVYEPLDKVTDDPLLRAIVLRDMEREWKQLHARYSDFEEFLELVRTDLGATA
jgi:hypothetical protein